MQDSKSASRLARPQLRLHRNAWSTSEIRRLRDLAAGGVPPRDIASILRRSEFSIRNKAGMHGTSLKRGA